MKKLYSLFFILSISCALFASNLNPGLPPKDSEGYLPQTQAYFADTSEEPECEGDELKADVNKFDHNYYLSWCSYKADFGVEKTYIQFPQRPTVSRGNHLHVAYAYDGNVLYSLNGYYPPMGNLNPTLLFDEILCNNSVYPYVVLSSTSYQASDGYYILDYISKDCLTETVIYGHVVVTPFNAYILQAIFPNGYLPHFDYFVDTFRIRCTCNH